jgi:hypothetical protein
MRALAALALVACGDRYGDPITVPTVGTQTLAHEPLDVTWQTELYIFPHSILGGGLLGVYGAHARALEPARCAARVSEDKDSTRPALVITGLAEGECDVELSYTHPTHGDTRIVTYRVVFGPAESLPAIAIGAAMPAVPFVLNLRAGSARCESNDRCAQGNPFCDELRCFTADVLPTGEPRYATQHYDDFVRPRSAGGVTLCVHRDDRGIVLGMRAKLDPPYGSPTPADLVWGEPNPACSE